jgi:hypothetical protein
MDNEKLSNALAFANYRITLTTQIEQIKATTKNKLVFAKNGGFFTITPQLIAFVDLLIREENKAAILLDDNETPVRITELSEFRKDILERYQTAVSDYFREYERLRKSRKVESIVGLNNEPAK